MSPTVVAVEKKPPLSSASVAKTAEPQPKSTSTKVPSTSAATT